MIDNPKGPKRGDVTEVVVAKKTDEYVIVETDYKNDGQIPASEFTERELKQLKEGAKIRVMAVGFREGMLTFSKIEAEKADQWSMLRTTKEKRQQILVEFKEFGEYLHRNRFISRKGYWGAYLNFKVFIPENEISRESKREHKNLTGLKLPVKIIMLMGRDKVIVASEKMFVLEERYKRREELLEKLDIGVILKGKVIRADIEKKAFIIDLNGLIGKMKFENVSWDRYQNPRERIKIGDTVEVVVVDFNKETKEVYLSLKDLTDDPWENVEEIFKIGDIVEGEVYRIFDFGAVINLNSDFRALIPNEELTLTRRVKNPKDIIHIGERLKGIIKRIDIDNRKIIVSIKDIILQKYNTGDIVKGKVIKVEKYGAFVELEPGVTGLLKVEDISWSKKVRNAQNLIKEGEIVEAKILSIDTFKRQIDFGVKQILPNPWDNVEEKYPIGSKAKGIVVKIIDAGAFINLDENFDAFLHRSKVSAKSEAENWKDKLEIGKEVEGTIIHINAGENKIQISLLEEANIKRTVKAAGHSSGVSQEEAPKEEEKEVTLSDAFSPEIIELMKKKVKEKEEEKTVNSEQLITAPFQSAGQVVNSEEKKEETIKEEVGGNKEMDNGQLTMDNGEKKEEVTPSSHSEASAEESTTTEEEKTIDNGQLTIDNYKEVNSEEKEKKKEEKTMNSEEKEVGSEKLEVKSEEKTKEEEKDKEKTEGKEERTKKTIKKPKKIVKKSTKKKEKQ